MKRIILTVITLTLAAGATMAQGASIREKGTPTDVSGTEITAWPGDIGLVDLTNHDKIHGPIHEEGR